MIFTPILGIVLLVLVARAFGFAASPRLADAADAARIAGDALPGFRAADVVIAADGRGALVAGRDGGIALVAPMGNRWLVRRADAARVRRDGDTIVLDLREWLFPVVRLDLGNAAAGWAGRFAGGTLPAAAIA